MAAAVVNAVVGPVLREVVGSDFPERSPVPTARSRSASGVFRQFSSVTEAAHEKRN